MRRILKFIDNLIERFFDKYKNRKYPITLKKDDKKITLFPVFHNTENEELNNSILNFSNIADQKMFVEGSLYLGGFIPEDANRENILVMLEEPDLFFGTENTLSLSQIYIGGEEIPDSSTHIRRNFEKIAYEIDSDIENKNYLRLANELLFLRRNYPNEVIYNQPEAWLRTVWYDADLIFYYLSSRDKFKLFGCLIYSDMDTDFIDFVRSHSNSINAMTGSQLLLFSFDGTHEKNSDITLNTEYTIYKSIIQRPERLGAKSAKEYDNILSEEERQLRELDSINRSILFAEKLSIPLAKTPCIAFWDDLDSKEILVFSFADYVNQSDLVKKIFKKLIDVVKNELQKQQENILERLEAQFGKLYLEFNRSRFDVSSSIGETIRSFLTEIESQNLNIDIRQENIMGDKYEAGQVGAQGPNAYAHNMTFNQIWNQAKGNIDLPTLSEQLKTLRETLQESAKSAEEFSEIGAIANAEIQAKKGNGPKALSELAKVGKWTLNVAEKIGIGVAIAAIKVACNF